jgi:hypothetical protein
MSESMERLKILVADIVDAKRKADEGIFPSDRISRSLRYVQADNARTPMAGMCGTCTSFLVEAMPPAFKRHRLDARCARASAPLAFDPTFHHYVVVRIEEMGKPSFSVVDLSVAQFFSRPLDLLGGCPYFVGTREGLRALVSKAQENTRAVLTDAFPDMAEADLKDFDARRNTDYDFLKVVHEVLSNAPLPCLVSESLADAWERTWGDYSRYLPGLSETLDDSRRRAIAEIWGSFLQPDPVSSTVGLFSTGASLSFK